MKKAYSHFVRVASTFKSGLASDQALDNLEGTVLSVGNEVKDIKKGMIVEFMYSGSRKVPNLKDGGVIYYVEDKAILSYEDTSK